MTAWLTYSAVLTASEWIGIATLGLSGIFVPILIKFFKTPTERRQVVITDAQNAQEILRGTNAALHESYQNEMSLRREWQRYAARLEDCLEQHKLDYPIEDRP